MRFFQTIFSGICLVLVTHSSQEARGWRGIVPLHSTRADVERLLGQSSDPCQCLYKTDGELVKVKYASAPCKGGVAGWNVPADTVLSFTVTSRTWQRFSDLNLDESKYVKTFDPDNPTTHYTNKDAGIRYTVTERGMVYYISYAPSTKDNHLLCPGFPLNVGSASGQRPFDFYSDIAVTDEQARLDNFAAWLRQHPDLNAYIVAYAGRRARVDETQARIRRAKSHLVNKRGIDARRIFTMDGGHREKSEVELYAVPLDMPAPAAMPTIAPSEVQIIGVTSVKANNGGSPRPRRKRRPPVRNHT